MIPIKRRTKDRELLNLYHDKPCTACGARPSDPAHIRTRGAGGDDLHVNLMPLCRRHHTMQHQIGWSRLAALFPMVSLLLAEKGWDLTHAGKLRRKI